MNLFRLNSNVQSKTSLGLIWQFLNSRDQSILKLIVAVQALLAVLDLIGVGLIGVIGALSVYGVQSQQSDSFARNVTELLRLDALPFQKQVLVLSVLTIVIFLSKTVASLWITNKSLLFISRRGALLSSSLLRLMLLRSRPEIAAYSRQDLIYAATFGVQNLTTGIIGISISIFSDLFLLFILALGLFIYSPALALTTLVLFVSIGTFLSSYLKNRAFKVGSVETKAHVKSSEILSEVFSTFRESLVRNTQEEYIHKFEKLRLQAASALSKRTFMPFVSKYVMEVSLILGVFLVAGTQFALYDAKTATAGLAIFFGASSRIAPAVLRIQQGSTEVRMYFGRSQQTVELLKLRSVDRTSLDNNDKYREPDFEAIGFLPVTKLEGVKFRYPGVPSFCLRIEELEIGANQHVAIVGSSGSGKTTLIDVILGALEPSEGTVSISGFEPKLAFKNWPGAVGYVPQETVVISGTVLENVLLGYDPSLAELSRVKDSLSLAGLKEFTSEDEFGLFLEVGGEGHRLSGGQRQRIGIARALYTSPKLLVLDEATSSLDSITEFDITKSLSELKKHMTLITIAHRLSTVKAADMVLYMENGEILASGPFEEVRQKVDSFDQQARLLGL